MSEGSGGTERAGGAERPPESGGAAPGRGRRMSRQRKTALKGTGHPRLEGRGCPTLGRSYCQSQDRCNKAALYEKSAIRKFDHT